MRTAERTLARTAGPERCCPAQCPHQPPGRVAASPSAWAHSRGWSRARRIADSQTSGQTRSTRFWPATGNRGGVVPLKEL